VQFSAKKSEVEECRGWNIKTLKDIYEYLGRKIQDSGRAHGAAAVEAAHCLRTASEVMFISAHQNSE
jgi:hypothetical protein